MLTRELVSELYGVALRDVYHVVFFDPALAVKITLKRRTDSGSIGDTDVYGAQQYAPLMEVAIPTSTSWKPIRSGSNRSIHSRRRTARSGQGSQSCQMFSVRTESGTQPPTGGRGKISGEPVILRGPGPSATAAPAPDAGFARRWAAKSSPPPWASYR